VEEVHHHNSCKAENGDVRLRRGAQISYSSLFFIRIDPAKPTCPAFLYDNVFSRLTKGEMLLFFLHLVFSGYFMLFWY